MSPIAAAIFDLDGVLVDSEPLYLRTERELLAPFGVDFTETMKQKYVGWSGREMLTALLAEYALPTSLDELLDRKDEIYVQLIEKELVLYQPTRDLLAALKAEDLPTALASGASPRIVQAVLDAFSLRTSFDVVVSAGDVPHGKPAPDAFLEAARRLGVDPAKCVVFEDSEVGVLAALAAGMRCVAIPYDATSPLPSAFIQADLLVEGGMEAFDVSRVLVWLRSA